MALTLTTELLNAQTAKVRQPIARVLSELPGNSTPIVGSPISNPVIDYPIDGPLTNDQGVSSTVFFDDGTMALFFSTLAYSDPPSAFQASPPDSLDALRFQITDTSGTALSTSVEVDEDVSNIEVIDSCIISEDPKRIGVVVQYASYPIGNWESHMDLKIVDENGVELSSIRMNYLDYLKGCSVIRTYEGTFAMFYIRRVTDSYLIYKTTSTDFITWSTPSVVTILGLGITVPMKDISLSYANGGYILMVSAVTTTTATSTIYNIRYALSPNLSDWGDSYNASNTTEINTDFTTPDVVEKDDGTLYVVSDLQNSWLHMDEDTTGWTSDEAMGLVNAWVDQAEGKLYVNNFHAGLGDKYFRGMAKIDIDTWTIDRCFHLGSSPAIPAIFNTTAHCFELNQNRMTGGYGTVHASDRLAVAVADFENDTIRTYYFYDYSGTFVGAEKNITGIEFDQYATLRNSEVIDDKLWLTFEESADYLTDYLRIGYIDINQTSPPYTFELVHDGSSPTLAYANEMMVRYYPDNDYALVSYGFCIDTSNYVAVLLVQSLSGDNSTIKCYKTEDYSSFPEQTVVDMALIGSTIWAIPRFDTIRESEVEKWGLMSIDMNSDIILYYYPPWITTPGTYFYSITVNAADNELIMRSTNGVAVFNYVTRLWERYDNTSNPEYPPEEGDGIYDGGDSSGVAYYNGSKLFFWGGVEHGLYAVPREGLVHTLVYSLAIPNGDEYDFSDFDPLALGSDNRYPSLSISPNNNVIISWTDMNEPNTIVVGNDAPNADISSYISGEISINQSMDNVSSVNLKLSYGHLFDPLNSNSLIRQYVNKGRRLVISLGDRVDGEEYFVNQGSFIIRDTVVKYGRGTYPEIEIMGEDLRCIWAMDQIATASLMERTPEEALDYLLSNQGEMEVGEYLIPTFPLSFEFDAQWIEAYFNDIVDDIAHRFQHFCYAMPDGRIGFKPMVSDRTPTNVYSLGSISQFSPDDSYSDFTNKVIVTGISTLDFQVIFAEEQLGSLNGTIGWWGYKNEFKINYAEDLSKRAIDPRLKVIETGTSILFQLAGSIDEYISDEDPDNKWCEVTVSAPSLIAILGGAILTYTAGNLIGDGVVVGGMTIPVGRKMEGVGVILALMVLGSMGNFQYEIWGRPIGLVKRNYSATSDDLPLQQELGKVVRNKIEGFLCSTPEHCQTVADFEIYVAQRQRNRATATKVAHLQDELGDTVVIPHPYTGEGYMVYVTDIVRRYKAASIGNNDGYIKDEISGWVIT